MKAATYDVAGGPEVLRYRDVPDPTCADDGLVIRVEAISVEGGDTINRASVAPPRPDYVVGYAAAGTIVETGRDARGFSVGQKVATMGMDGAYAELRAVAAATSWAIPDGLTVDAAAALPIAFGTAHHCLFAAGALRRGDTVLVQGGAGGLGIALIQLAHRAGARTLATVSGADRTSRLERLGLDIAIDHRREDVANAAWRLTGGRGVDLTVDPIGTTLAGSLAALRPHGKLVFVGNAGGGSLTLDLWPALQANIVLSGVFMGTEFGTDAVRETVVTLLALAAEGEIQVPIDRTFPLADAAGAHHYIAGNEVFGRVLLRP